METYEIWMLIVGIACFGAAWLPHLLHGKPISFPVVYVGFGAVVFTLPLGLNLPDPFEYPVETERLTELVVILALMGVGLKLDRPVGWRQWMSTWRLLGITMVLSIAAFAFTGWALIGLSPVAAILLGAVLAPTDPVLAADVQAGPPMEGDDDEIRFALTSESGLNDGLAFPFSNLAIAVAAAYAGKSNWFSQWLWYDVLYKVAAGVILGMVIGYFLAWLVFRVRLARTRLAQTGEGLAAIAITLTSYAATELVNGYGFLAVFIAALMIRHYEKEHEYHKTLHAVADNVERLLMVVVLVVFGGVLANGLLAPLTWPAVLASLAFIFLVRPLTGLLGLAGMDVPLRHRTAIAFFGIRGVGSFYYLAYVLNRIDLAEGRLLWAIVGFVVLVSIVVHGITAVPLLKLAEKRA